MRVGGSIVALAAVWIAVSCAAAHAAAHTLRVCRHGCRYRTLQRAVDHADAGDTIRVLPGHYRAGAFLDGPGKDRIRIIGASRSRRHWSRPGAPPSARRVVFDGRGVRGEDGDSGIVALDVDGLVVRNLSVRNYRSNGVFVLCRTNFACGDYVLDRIYASGNGAYGLYAFNARGGRMTNSTGVLSGDAGFYIGATPPQSRPHPTLVDRVRSRHNAGGFSGTNLRYVTIRRSYFFNNGSGIQVGAHDSEPYQPPEDNLIEDNDIFWNNVDLRGRGSKRPPFKPIDYYTQFPFAYPGNGSGIVVLGGDRTLIRSNRVFGNYLHGVAIFENTYLDPPGAPFPPRGNQVTGNAFGRAGADPNGVADLYYGTQATGSGNCWSNSPQSTDPVAGGSYPSCPFAGANPALASQLQRGLAIAGAGPPSFWVRRRHPGFAGLSPRPSNPQ